MRTLVEDTSWVLIWVFMLLLQGSSIDFGEEMRTEQLKIDI